MKIEPQVNFNMAIEKDTISSNTSNMGKAHADDIEEKSNYAEDNSNIETIDDALETLSKISDMTETENQALGQVHSGLTLERVMELLS